MPDWMDQEELAQAAVEYVADYYAGSWWPWAKNYMEMRQDAAKEAERGE